MDRGLADDERSWGSDGANFSDEEPAIMQEGNSRVRFEDSAKTDLKEKRKKKAIAILRTASSVRETNIFQAAFDQIEEMDVEECSLISQKLKYVIRNNGLERDDPRVSDVLDEIDDLEKKGIDFSFESFTAELQNNFTFFRKVINNQFTYGNYEAMYEECKQIFHEVKDMPV